MGQPGLLVHKVRRLGRNTTDDPGSPLFATEFDAAIGRDDSGSSKDTAFGLLGFNSVHDETTDPTNANGWLSTVAEIPEHVGTSIPCASGRALRIEARPTINVVQPDVHLQLDPSGSGAQGAFPAELWWEYWVFPNRTGSEMSEFSENKLWYWLEAGDTGGYPNGTFEDVGRTNVRNYLYDPVTGAVHQTGYTTGSFTFELLGGPSATGVPRLAVAAQVNDAPQRHSPNYQDGEKEWIRPNQWTKVREHKSIGQSPGRHRIWTRPISAIGDAAFSLIMDTAVAGVTYDTVSRDWPGSRMVRFPTTVGPTNGTGLDFYLYLTRLRFASSEANLGFQRSY